MATPLDLGQMRACPRLCWASWPATEPGSEHELELALLGDYGRGGITGPVLLGPAQSVIKAAQKHEIQPVSLALGLSLLVSGFIPDESMMHSAWHRLHKPVRTAHLIATVGRLRR
jgi:hypothetical protein